MARKYKFCLHCRRTIAENEVQRGLFVQTPQGMLCATCAQQLDEETEAAKQLAAAQAPVPAEPKEEFAQAIEEKPSAEAPEEEPPSRPAPAPPVSAREEAPADAPTPAAPDPPAGPPPGGPAPPPQLLDDIRQHVEAIHRTLVFERSSLWNVLATIAQCLAIGMLIVGAVNWADNPTHLLLAALIFQVMALTFFVRGK